MSVKIIITEEPIDHFHVESRTRSTNSGAVVEFLGIVREDEHGESITGINYEAFREMAEHQLHLLADKQMQLHSLQSLTCVHRTGFVAVGETSFFVQVASEHRREAFAAIMEFIDEVKRTVPIWKHPIT